MAIQVEIGGRDYTVSDGTTASGLNWASLRVTDVFAPTGNQADIEGVVNYYDMGSFVMPRSEEEMRVTFYSERTPSGLVDPSSAEVLFGGVVENVHWELINQGRMFIRIMARDYMKWLDRKLVSGVYIENTPGAMVRHLLLNFADMQDIYDMSDPRFYDADIDVEFGQILPKAFSYRKPSEAVQEIAEATDAVWWPDHQKGVHFIPTEGIRNRAPFGTRTVPILTRDGRSIIPPNPVAVYDLDTEYNASDFKMEESSVGLQNSLVVQDLNYRSPQTLYIPANDDNTGWSASTHRFESSHVANRRLPLPEIPYDLSDTDFSVEFDRGNGYYELTVEPDPINRLSDRIYDPPAGTVFVGFGGRVGGPYIRWSADERVNTNTAYRIKLRPFYAALFSQTSRNTSSSSYYRRTSGGVHDGIFETLINFGDLEFTGENPIRAFEEFATNLLARRSWPVYNGSFTCLSTNQTGWRARQRFYLTSETFDLYDLQHWDAIGSPDYDQNRPYHETRPVIPGIIKSVTTTVQSPDLLQYEMEWSSTISDI